MFRPTSLQTAWGDLDAWNTLRNLKITEVVNILKKNHLNFNEFLNMSIMARSQIAEILHPQYTRDILKRRVEMGGVIDNLRSCALDSGRYEDFLPYLRNKYFLLSSLHTLEIPIPFEAYGDAKTKGLSYMVHSQVVIKIENIICSVLSEIDLIDVNNKVVSKGFHIVHTRPENFDKLLQLVSLAYDKLNNLSENNLEMKIDLVTLPANTGPPSH